MIYLILSIASSSLLFVLFKLFSRYKVNTLQAIVVNYVIAFLCGLIFYGKTVNATQIISSNWFLGAAILGVLFITIFNVMAITSQRNGLSVASVAGKMSVVVPVIFGIYIYDEGVGAQKIIGILLALVAVYLTSIKSKTAINSNKGLLFPVLLFIGSGIIDTSIKYMEHFYVQKEDIALFSATIFIIAGILGFVSLIYLKIRNRFKFDYKSLVGGAFLGVFNYFSMYYLIRALQVEGFESSTLFTLNNVATVMLTTLFGLFLFKETLYTKNWIGIALAVISISLITLA